MEILAPHSRKFARMLIYSPPGHGKTYLLGTAQEDERTYPMVFLDFEGGTETLDGLDIDVVPIRSWQDFNEAYQALVDGELIEFDGKEYDFAEYKSIGIDSISEVHRFALLDILRVAAPSRKDPDLLEQRDYGKASVQMRRLLRQFRDLPMHVFFSAHAKQIEEPRQGRITVPDLAGQLSDEISGLVSVVGYLAESVDEDGELERLLLLHGYPKYRTKVRTPWNSEAPTEIADPDITEILDVLGYKASPNGKKRT